MQLKLIANRTALQLKLIGTVLIGTVTNRTDRTDTNRNCFAIKINCK